MLSYYTIKRWHNCHKVMTSSWQNDLTHQQLQSLGNSEQTIILPIDWPTMETGKILKNATRRPRIPCQCRPQAKFLFWRRDDRPRWQDTSQHENPETIPDKTRSYCLCGAVSGLPSKSAPKVVRGRQTARAIQIQPLKYGIAPAAVARFDQNLR